MDEQQPVSDSQAISRRTVEMVVAGLFIAGGAVVMFESWRIGMGWRIEGPQSGYFPFYIGLLIVLASAVTLLKAALTPRAKDSTFVRRAQLKQVFAVLIPTTVYVVAVRYIGLYVASALFIGGFMAWIGAYSWRKFVPIALAIPLLLFFIFEHWFLLPLPKGPLELWLGY